MKVIRYNKSTQKKEVVNYPRYDMGEIIGLDPSIEFFYMEESSRPEYNPKISNLEKDIVLTNISHKKYPHIKKATINWIIKPKVLPNLEEIKQEHFREVQEVTREISSIIESVKNRYDAFGESPEKVPKEFKTLVKNISHLRDRADLELNNLKNPEEAIVYKVRGEK